MMNNERKGSLQAAITNLLHEDVFCEKLAACKNADETQSCLAAYGIEISLEEIAEFTALGEKTIKNYSSSNELSASELEDVTGGGWLRKAGRFLAASTGGAVLGFATGICPGLAPVTTVYAVTAAYWVSKG